MTLEVCCPSLQSLKAACQGGATRVELCQALSLDGLTPSAAMIEMAVESGIRVHVLVRPREGDFVYDEAEAECMVKDIRMARRLGAHGVVIGALTTTGDIDLPLCTRLCQEASGMDITFHRAFDVCRSPMHALEQIIGMGCTRLLTSGCSPSAEEGSPLLRQLVTRARELSPTFHVMPGAGVNADNALRILQETGATEIHGSLRGKDGHTDVETVHRVVTQLSSGGG